MSSEMKPASLLGARLREERERIGFAKQKAFADQVGVTRESQGNYERGSRSPDADYLSKAAALGVDVQYVVTGYRSRASPPEGQESYKGGGIRSGEAIVLTAQELAVVANYRSADEQGRKAIEVTSAAVGHGDGPSKTKVR
jgi:transcriptional regulator with XRE-family HTH domain